MKLRSDGQMARSGTMTNSSIPRPESGDVVELILDDHRLFEELLRRLRDETEDRAAVRSVLADVLIAHGESEEQHVYPALVRKDAIELEDAEHGEREHAEGNQALLAVLEVEDTSSEKFSNAVEELSKALAHHVDEEERDILNPARTEVPEKVRADLGVKFAKERNAQLDAGCGSVENVRKVVAKGRKKTS